MKSLEAKVRLTMMLMMAFFPDWINARIYNNCELAEALVGQGIAPRDTGTWVCIASYESGLDSDLIGKSKGDGTWDHGLWQINDRYWVGKKSGEGRCGFSGAEIRGENFANAVQCVKTIRADHQQLPGDGWVAWAVFAEQGHCHGDTRSYVAECFP